MFKPEMNFYQPKFEEEKIEQYNFLELKKYEPQLIKMVAQMKDEIENGSYDTLLSDDIGGRIPTLVLRKIIQAKNPDLKLHTFFVSGGFVLPGRDNFIGAYDNYFFNGDCYLKDENSEEALRYYDSEEKPLIRILKEYIKQNIKNSERKILICSEYSHNGKTLIALGKYLEQVGCQDFDIASLGLMSNDYLSRRFPSSRIYSASYSSPEPEPYEENYDKFRNATGVYKNCDEEADYLPYPDKLKGKTSEQQREIKENIKKLREDIDKLSKKVVNEVWGK